MDKPFERMKLHEITESNEEQDFSHLFDSKLFKRDAAIEEESEDIPDEREVDSEDESNFKDTYPTPAQD